MPQTRVAPPRRLPAPAVTVMSRAGVFRDAVAPTVRSWYTPIDGTSTLLVRPYLTAHEREEDARLQHLWRDIPWRAAYGVGLGARDVHARPGAAS
ncbi:hypothetical protein [Streptomyces sp. NPDC006134]|uniref:hypothetical protein n=1 Tax=Streptomyces sp. NPDC006134 TaxID=3154467 RepID=UPI0033E06B0C